MSDLILFNGKLWTQDPRFPDATALAMQAGRILAVGSDDDILALAGPRSRVIDLDGRRVLPGLVDAHFHFKGWALSRRELRLAGLPSLAAVQEALAPTRRGHSSRPMDQGPGLERDRLARAAAADPTGP